MKIQNNSQSIYRKYISLLFSIYALRIFLYLHSDDGFRKIRNMSSFKNIVVFIKILLHFVLLRSFGKIYLYIYIDIIIISNPKIKDKIKFVFSQQQYKFRNVWKIFLKHLKPK